MIRRARFDQFSASYEELLRDPIREHFTGKESGYFHLRKRDLICDHFRRRGIDTAGLSYLDVGCGKGELLQLLSPSFTRCAGCDLSAEMMHPMPGIETRLQQDASKIPLPDCSADFITAVCVYHHVAVEARPALSLEIFRVLKPGGTFAIIEHNPWNPITRLIVSRTPVDEGAILLPRRETRELMRGAGLAIREEQYFLFLPEKIYRRVGGLESWLRRVPAGGQYAVFGVKPLGGALAEISGKNASAA
ncbi:MAG TPA: class I SAM-dependent methyltransferase [Bryobacteraceae bacterium]|nr:class I SAM-dependent methyltransferase [Bryobacteraceae bacterium]